MERSPVSTRMATSNATLPRTDRGPERQGRRVQREVRPLRPYEVMVILDAGLEEDVIRATIDRATGVISAGGGNPGRVDRWGKRRFAYELNHRWEGFYVLLEASAEPSAMADLDRMLSLTDEVIRHKVIRLPDVVANRAVARSSATAAAAVPTDGGESTKEG
jgi:small subunit ribosomal protein S6